MEMYSTIQDIFKSVKEHKLNCKQKIRTQDFPLELVVGWRCECTKEWNMDLEAVRNVPENIKPFFKSQAGRDRIVEFFLNKREIK